MRVFYFMICKICNKNNLKLKSKKYCNVCFKENEKKRLKEWRLNNIEKSRESSKKRYFKNKEVLKIKQREYKRKKRNDDDLFYFKEKIRNLIYIGFKKSNCNKNNKTEKILGCKIDFFIEYIISKFKIGMTLENHGKWHLDHIKPISLAKNHKEVFELNKYTNFQPLWAEENLKKSNKY